MFIDSAMYMPNYLQYHSICVCFLMLSYMKLVLKSSINTVRLI